MAKKRAARQPKKNEGKALEARELPAALAIYKTREFEAFAAWMALPAHLIRATDDQLLALRVDDERLLELLRIKNRADFAEKFGVHPGTLSEWGRKLHETGYFNDVIGWARGLTKNVVFAIYANVMKDGDAARGKLWMQIIEKMNLLEGGGAQAGGSAGPSLHVHFHNDRILKIVSKSEDEIEEELKREIQKAA